MLPKRHGRTLVEQDFQDRVEILRPFASCSRTALTFHSSTPWNHSSLFVTLSKGEGSGGRGTRRYCQADVDSSTSLRVSVFDCQGLLGGWDVVLHPGGSPASYGVQLQK